MSRVRDNLKDIRDKYALANPSSHLGVRVDLHAVHRCHGHLPQQGGSVPFFSIDVVVFIGVCRHRSIY